MSQKIRRRRRARGLGRYPIPRRLVCVMSSPSGVWGGAPAAMAIFCAFYTDKVLPYTSPKSGIRQLPRAVCTDGAAHEKNCLTEKSFFLVYCSIVSNICLNVYWCLVCYTSAKQRYQCSCDCLSRCILLCATQVYGTVNTEIQLQCLN